MKRALAWLCAVLMLSVTPSWASQSKVSFIKLDANGCWQEEGNNFVFAVNIKAPVNVFLIMNGAETPADEAVKANWKNRVPAFWRNTEDVPIKDRIVEFTEYDNQISHAEILTSGQYLLAVADRHLRGLRGITKVCVFNIEDR